jgi:hypothetical protein
VNSDNFFSDPRILALELGPLGWGALDIPEIQLLIGRLSVGELFSVGVQVPFGPGHFVVGRRITVDEFFVLDP